MKLSIFPVRLAIIVLAATFCASAMAKVVDQQDPAPHHVGKKKAALAAAAAAAGASGAAAVGKLDEAYGILAHLDHDYKGHRASAMHKIEEAAKVMGSTLHGGGKGGEKQTTSDAGMRQAESLLTSAVGGLVGRPRHHVQEAIHQLNIALRVK